MNAPFDYEGPVKVTTTLPTGIDPKNIWGDGDSLQVRQSPSSEPLVLQWLDGIHWREYAILVLAMATAALLGSLIVS